MRLKNVPGSREVIAESRFVIHNPEENKGKWAGCSEMMRRFI